MSEPDSTNFGGTLTGGIQDISALLPLLGTEQCENHVGSALERGFLYSSVTPISIFGSLGIVRAAFNILVASLSIERLGFLGASKLKDGGFLPTGDVAPMLAFDPEHPKRFIVESKLEAMVAEEHIENVEGLTVSWADGTIRWNLLLLGSALIMASAGLLPYVLIVIDSGSTSPTKLFPLGFGFPILRVVGSALCVTLTQFLIQVRILVLLKTRLLFVSIDRLAKEEYIDIGLELNRRSGQDWRRSRWDPELASERCIWVLRTYINAGPGDALEKHPGSQNIHATIKKIYDEQYHLQMESIYARFPRWVDPILVSGLVLGGCSTVVGYIGCFYLIQHSVKSNGPLLWLLLEALLSIFRILVWAFNPAWDDSQGIVWELSSRHLLITCDKSESDFRRDGVAPIMPSSEFDQAVRMYTGRNVHSVFGVPADIEVYYIRGTDGDGASKQANGRLYIVLSDRRDPQASLLLFKEFEYDLIFSTHMCFLERPLGKAINSVQVDWSNEMEGTEIAAHPLTSNPTFMARLSQHYDDIVGKIQKQQAKQERTFYRTWKMQRFSRDGLIDPPEDVLRNKTQYAESLPWTVVAGPYAAYIRQGHMQKRCYDLYQQLEEWIELFMALHTKELLSNVPADLVSSKDESASFLQLYQANEARFILVECQSILDSLLSWTIGKWDQYAKENHDEVVATLKGSFKSMGGSGRESGASDGKQWHGNDLRKTKATTRFSNKLQELGARAALTLQENMSNRLAAQHSVKQRIQAYQHTNPTREAIIKAWNDMSDGVNSPSPPSDDDLKAVIGKRRTNYIAIQNTRHLKALEEVASSVDDHAQGERVVNELYSKCQQRTDMVFARLEHQCAEFADLHSPDVLITHGHELVIYWSTPALQERMRLLSRARRYYLRLDNKAFEAVGGLQSMFRALKRSQDFVYMDLQAVDLLGHDDITAIVESVESVIGLGVWSGCDPPGDSKPSFGLVIAQRRSGSFNVNVGTIGETFKKRRQGIFQSNGEVCFFTDVTVLNSDSQGESCLLFEHNGKSRCDIHFLTKTKSDHSITVRHYTPVSLKEGRAAEVVIRLNGRDITNSCRWGRSAAIHTNFADEALRLPREHLEVGQRNELEIVLNHNSPAEYFLSDVFLPVRPVPDDSVPEDATA